MIVEAKTVAISHKSVQSPLRFGAFAITALVCGALSGCMVGPDYKRPETPNPTGYTAAPMPDKTAASPVTGGEAQHFVNGRDIPAQWWSLFQSEPLDNLVRRAFADSPTLSAARARLREAEENLRAGEGALFPFVDASASATREKLSGAEFGTPGNNFHLTLYNASVNVSYALDIFGGTRRGIEALQSMVDYQRYQLEGSYLTITSNIVTSAVQEASLRAQIRASQEILAAEEKQLEIIEQQYNLGGISLSDVLAQRTQVAQTRTTLPPLMKQLDQTRHRIAVLTGGLPAEAGTAPEFDLDGLRMPQELPVSLPSSLARQRPDIRASEELLHAASAQVGVATADLYPKITLTGSYGSETNKLRKLFGNETSIWSLGADLLQPIFHGGQLNAKRRAAVAAYDQAAAQYRETVLLAFQDVADVLRALDADANTLRAQADAEAAARNTLELTQAQFRLGAVSYLSLLNAQQRYQQARIGLVQAQAARFADTAALFQALGGGWWNRAGEGAATNGGNE